MSTTLKDISTWDEVYVQNLPVGEFDWIDFKDSRWLDLSQTCLDKLSKYVSAFANFDGGYLVIGVKDPKLGQPIQIDGGVNLGIKPDLKGWLEDILPNLVDPPIQRLNVHLLGHNVGSSIAHGNVLVIIHIPASDAAPHQARDHKYYTRLGTKLNPIGHQAVLDILNRKKYPVVQMQVFINLHPQGGKHNIFWRVTNLSDVFSRYVMTRVQLPINVAGQHISLKDQSMLVLDDDKTTVWPLVCSNHLSDPLFPRGTIARRFEFELRGPALDMPTIPEIRYTTFADQMQPQEGIIAIEDALNATRKKKDEQ